MGSCRSAEAPRSFLLLLAASTAVLGLLGEARSKRSCYEHSQPQTWRGRDGSVERN